MTLQLPPRASVVGDCGGGPSASSGLILTVTVPSTLVEPLIAGLVSRVVLPSAGLSITSVGAAAAESTGPSAKPPAATGAATIASTKPVTALLAM